MSSRWLPTSSARSLQSVPTRRPASSGFGSTMTGKTDEIVTYVTQTTDRLSQMIDSRRGSLVEALNAKTSQLSTEIDRVTADSLKAIESRGQAFSQNMSVHGSDVA